MDEKIHLVFLVIFSLSLHHQVQTQKANFCNVTEPYFVEVTKTETILGFKPKSGGFNLLGVFAGNKYENVTKTVMGVEKRERVIEECCKGYKKKDDQCVPIDDTKPSKEPSSTTTTTTTTTTATPSSTSTTAAPIPSEPPPATEPATQPSPSESAPSVEPSVAPDAASDPTTPTNPVLEPTSSPDVPPPVPSEPPVTTSSPAPEPEPPAEPVSTSETPSAASSESPVTTSSSAPPSEAPFESASVPEIPPPTPSESPSSAPEAEVPPETSPVLSESLPVVSSSEAPPQTTAQASQAENIMNDDRPKDEPILSSIMVTTNEPTKIVHTTTPQIISYSASESPTSMKPAPSSELTTTKQSEKLIDDATVLNIDLTTIINGRRRRSLDESSNDDDDADSIEVLEFESNNSSDDPSALSASHKSELKLNEEPVSEKTHRHLSDSDSIVVSDLTADVEDQGYPWVEILEVLSFGAIVFLLVITVQMSFNVEPYSLSKGNKKIPQEIDSYGEYWVCDSQSSLEEV